MTRRITDQHGHRWPITGHRCPACRLPADPILDGQPHPGCRPARTVSPDTQRAAVALIRGQLGGQPIERWLVADEPTTDPRHHPVPAAKSPRAARPAEGRNTKEIN